MYVQYGSRTVSFHNTVVLESCMDLLSPNNLHTSDKQTANFTLEGSSVYRNKVSFHNQEIKAQYAKINYYVLGGNKSLSDSFDGSWKWSLGSFLSHLSLYLNRKPKQKYGCLSKKKKKKKEFILIPVLIFKKDKTLYKMGEMVLD